MENKEIDYNKLIAEFAEKLPKFSDGRIDYSNSDKALVLTCFIKFNEKFLLLKRSDKVRTYRGKWNVVAGYLDELKSLKEKILEEINEELGIPSHNINTIKTGLPYEMLDLKIQKTWIIYPALVELTIKPEIKLDWEHTEFRWISIDELNQYDTVPNLKESLERALN